jgi:hypothetical protein
LSMPAQSSQLEPREKVLTVDKIRVIFWYENGHTAGGN